MPLYHQNADGKYVSLKKKALQTEKELQRVVEANLPELLDVHFLETEYTTTSGGRIDTLGVDRDGAPVIIEYKRTQNDNVINQALSYQKWLTAQKREFFEMLIGKRLSEDITGALEVDWKHPRIICIAESFNKFDIDTADVLLPVFRVELMTYRVYENGILQLEPLQIVTERQATLAAASASTTSINQSGDLAEYSIDFHRKKGSPEIQDLFDELRARIIALGPQVVERPVQPYIGYRVSKNFPQVYIQKSQLRIQLRPIEYDDQRKIVQKISNHPQWTLTQQVSLSSPDDLDYVMGLVEQSYNNVL